MGVLHTMQLIRSGRLNNTKVKQEEHRQFKAQKVSLPPPLPTPVPHSSSCHSNHPRPVTKQPLQPVRPANQSEASQLKTPHSQPKSPTPTKLDNTARMSEFAIITQVYGPSANIYTDVLSVSPTASQHEIREAFFCLRYGIYQQLSEEGDANGPLSQEERQRVEMKMDAISAAFQILNDRNKRKMYDDSLAQKQGGGAGQGGAHSAPSRDSQTKPANKESTLSIGQKRSEYRRQMKVEQRRSIQGAMNERKVPAPVFVGDVKPEEEDRPSRNVRGMSIREQMMAAHEAKKISIKTSEDVIDQRQDKEESPTAVDEFDSMNKFKNVKIDDTKSRSRAEVKSTEPDEGTYDEDEGTYDDDSRTYGTYDDQTYDDGEESYYTYGDTTLGTYDDSTYVTYDDDQTYETNDDRGKYSPSHKTGDMPEPILKGSTPRGKTDKKKANRRVTIHSHRGKGESGAAGFGFDDAYEELAGTYKDFKDTLNQVGGAFLLSPDDIDKMSDRIRDAQIELIENYEKQTGAAGKEQKGKKGVKLPKPSKKAIKN